MQRTAKKRKSNALARLGRLEEAEQALARAIAMDPGRAEYHNNMVC